jgi:hypothetical protein
MAGAGVDEDGSVAGADAAVVGALVSIDKGSVSGFEADIAAFELDDVDCSGFVFSLPAVAAGAVSDMAEELETGGKEEEMGDVVEIETSLRGPCEPAPLPVRLEDSRLLNSTSVCVVFNGGGALEEGPLAGEAWPAPVVDSAAAAIGRAAWGCERCRFMGNFDLTPLQLGRWNQ